MARATVTDLYRVEGRAELISGDIARLPCWSWHGEVAVNVLMSLRSFAKTTGRGKAMSTTLAYVFPELPSGRETFSPSASYYDGPLPENRMEFIKGPPTFAVEVRRAQDYESGACEALTAKRTDYFQSGTLVVRGVDPRAETVTKYSSDADSGTVFRSGDTADAEPAVPGWRITVDDIFAE